VPKTDSHVPIAKRTSASFSVCMAAFDPCNQSGQQQVHDYLEKHRYAYKILLCAPERMTGFSAFFKSSTALSISVDSPGPLSLLRY